MLSFLVALSTKYYIKYSDKSVLNIERFNAFDRLAVDLTQYDRML